MKTYSFYDKATGAIHPTIFSSDDDSQLANNTPADNIAIDGQFDSLSQRVDIATGLVLDYQPPAPSADHEWNAITKRWQLSAAAQSKIDNHNSAITGISSVELRSLRALREWALGMPGAADRLKAIDDEITSLRPQI